MELESWLVTQFPLPGSPRNFGYEVAMNWLSSCLNIRIASLGGVTKKRKHLFSYVTRNEYVKKLIPKTWAYIYEIIYNSYDH